MRTILTIIVLSVATFFNNVLAANYFSGCPIEEPNEVVAFCTGENNLGITFPAKTSSKNVDAFYFGSVGCLGSTPSPSWFIMQIEDEGTLQITMDHSDFEDIDFACWGPYRGRNKTEVLNTICSDPDTYFKSPSIDGELFINKCEIKYNKYIDSIAQICFTEKTGLPISYIYFYEYDYLECENYAASLVPADIENDYRRTLYYDPTDEEVSDCFVTMKPEEVTLQDCSYSDSYQETCTIHNAKHGDWYILLITNYSQMPGDIFFNKTGGTATTNCKIIIDATSNGPHCEGDNIKFTVNNAPQNATFQWRGPNGFTSTDKEPVIKNATINDAGSYYVKMHSGDETSDEVEVLVEVGQTSTQDTTVVIKAGESYKLGNRVITQGGSYTANLLSRTGCDSIVNLTVVVIENDATILPSGPYCEGESIVLEGVVANETGEVLTSTWSGPNNFSANGLKVTIENATPKMSGTYKLTISNQLNNQIKKEVEVVVNPAYKSEQKTITTKENPITFGNEVINEAGTYTHTFKSKNGCDSIVTLIVEIPNIIISNSGPYCEGDNIQITAEGLTEEQNFEWSGPNGFKSKSSMPTIENANKTHSGTYSLYLKEEEKNILAGSTDVVIMENVMEKIIEQLSLGETLQFGELIIDQPGEYTQTFKSAEGCDSTVSLTVRMKLDEKTTIHPSEFFTPNGDGISDVWEIENIELYPEAIVDIYDRHGKLIRKYTNYDNLTGWDGTDVNGIKMPSTDYWYTIDVNSIDKIYIGHFTLIR